jgi:hypothetical protein
LERRRGNLVAALKSGREPPVIRAAKILEATLAEAVGSMSATAQKENRPWKQT